MPTEKKNRIVIIDSGIQSKDDYPNIRIDGCGISRQNDGTCFVDTDWKDGIGHGTAVLDQLLRHTDTIGDVFAVKICHESIETESEVLLFALRYVLENIPCDIILISSGMVCCEKYQELLELCKALTSQGKWIVSAFSNEGEISFPAACPSVIGVGTVQKEYESPHVTLDSVMEVVLADRYYRLKWVNPQRIIIRGSSFAAPCVAAVLSEILVECGDRRRVLRKNDILRKIAEKMHLPLVMRRKSPSSWDRGITFVRNIRKAVVFPWNKEMHSIARFREMLPFKIYGYYDSRYSFNIGKEIGELIQANEMIGAIQNIDDLNWNEDFDTFILGHVGKLSGVSRVDYLSKITQLCAKNKKMLYSFDPEAKSIISQAGIDKTSFVPEVTRKDIDPTLGGRLYVRSVPLVGVFGTSSEQGKFTVQMELRKKFQEEGYKVTQISTEPSGYLYGAVGVFPYGYHSSIKTRSDESIQTVNRMVWEAGDEKGQDIIVTGSQSGSVPYEFGNIGQFNVNGYVFLCGTNPDAFVLCVNLHDDPEYIAQTIHYLESFNKMPVVSLVVNPYFYESISSLGLGYRKKKVEQSDFKLFQKKMEELFMIPVVLLGEKEWINRVYDAVISALSDDNE